ncbi:hypothetical protein [Salmonella enterica]|nr:hypothetical protein [Salmonella enterica]MCE9493893.1 hypothetical protein [Salmonella enterica subsp. enterica serovar Typhimurium var. 5-]
MLLTDLLHGNTHGGMACQAAGKPWQAYACLKCRRAAPAALPFLPVMV